MNLASILFLSHQGSFTMWAYAPLGVIRNYGDDDDDDDYDDDNDDDESLQ